jgi:DNA (cytosine-5)-methyltransferase 1
MTYYNENDPKAAAWLRELIAQGHIPAGTVDNRSIEDVTPDELHEFDQCHFFAGIGGWPYAFRLAGWPDDRPVWTGSCPCQPFSCAGKQRGTDDARHLWPVWFRLIEKRRPAICFGEQVASPIALQWLDGVFADLEGAGYACAASDLCAAGVGAPHPRQRIYWLADADRNGTERSGSEFKLDANGPVGRLADASFSGPLPASLSGLHRKKESARARNGKSERRSPISGLADACEPRLEGFAGDGVDGDQSGWVGAGAGRPTAAGRPWDTFDLTPCGDGKIRRIESGTFPLADGIPNRMVRLRGYGNAIVPQVAAEFIQAALEALEAY